MKTETVEVNVQEVEGILLAYLVAQAQGKRVGMCVGRLCYFYTTWEDGNEPFFIPSHVNTRELINLIESDFIQSTVVYTNGVKSWQCFYNSTSLPIGDGPTMVVAAMRCLIASKLGYKIKVPKEIFDAAKN